MASRAIDNIDAAGSQDRWLLMRLLAAGRGSPALGDRLIGELGSLGGVLAASRERLERLGADSASVAMLGLVREAVSAVLDRRLHDRPLLDLRALADSARAELAHFTVEQVRAAFLDAGRRVLRVEALSTGSVHSAHVYPREVARRALELGASAVVLVHNHPSGDPTPSPDDVKMTAAVKRALDAIEVDLIDHLVVARSGDASMRALKLI
jgi:DNA repair protein RadC